MEKPAYFSWEPGLVRIIIKASDRREFYSAIGDKIHVREILPYSKGYREIIDLIREDFPDLEEAIVTGKYNILRLSGKSLRNLRYAVQFFEV